MSKPIIICHPSMEGIIKNLWEKFQDRFKYMEGYYPALRGDVSWKKFPDAWPDIFIKTDIKNRDVIFIASLDDQATLFEQFAVLYAIPRYQAKSLNVIIPYFPGTMDRVDETGQVVTAMTMARMLSAIPLTKSGPAIITIYDIHALQEQFFFGDKVIPDLRTTIPLFRKWLEQTISFEERKMVSIVYPDDGARKRFSKMFSGYDEIVCDKVRQGESRIVTIREGNAYDRICFIIDDIIMKGGTAIECRNVLSLNGARSISVFAPHGVCPGESWKKFTPDLFDRVIITDSCQQTAKAVKELKHFKVLTFADLIYNML